MTTDIRKNQRKRLASGENLHDQRSLNIKETAAYTGPPVQTIYTMVSQRRILYVKVERLTKFDRTLLDK